MRWRAELSAEAQEQLEQLPPNEFEALDDSQWCNIKALQGQEWKERLRKRVGPYRITFQKVAARGVVEISAILIKSKSTYR
jgi:mRNA-degrading endonuclease RelE of RelBE toxin-antitoxin system